MIDALFELCGNDLKHREDAEALREVFALDLEKVRDAAIEQMEQGKSHNLYWCSTADHDEDWLVLARSRLEARRFHAAEKATGSTM